MPNFYLRTWSTAGVAPMIDYKVGSRNKGTSEVFQMDVDFTGSSLEDSVIYAQARANSVPSREWRVFVPGDIYSV